MRKIIVKVDKEKATELERVNFELNFVKDGLWKEPFHGLTIIEGYAETMS